MRLTLPEYLADMSKWAEYFKILIWQVDLIKSQSEIPEHTHRERLHYTFDIPTYMHALCEHDL